MWGLSVFPSTYSINTNKAFIKDNSYRSLHIDGSVQVHVFCNVYVQVFSMEYHILDLHGVCQRNVQLDVFCDVYVQNVVWISLLLDYYGACRSLIAQIMIYPLDSQVSSNLRNMTYTASLAIVNTAE